MRLVITLGFTTASTQKNSAQNASTALVLAPCQMSFFVPFGDFVQERVDFEQEWTTVEVYTGEHIDPSEVSLNEPGI